VRERLIGAALDVYGDVTSPTRANATRRARIILTMSPDDMLEGFALRIEYDSAGRSVRITEHRADGTRTEKTYTMGVGETIGEDLERRLHEGIENRPAN
jgi:YD repeat-containing protein